SSLQSRQYTPYRPVTYSGDSPPHTVVFNFSYELPFGPKKKLLNGSNPVLGYPAKFANYVPGVPIFSQTNPRNFDPAVDRYFAPAGAFVTPPNYQFGNTAPTLDWVRGWTQKAESIS